MVEIARIRRRGVMGVPVGILVVGGKGGVALALDAR
jgi:hypothetical protein